eukprot:TRINITY_DN14752_c0_g2_i2.p1 TRINITY_DN14752_c0_g2~~TRINITY_DN14752_c0_g2_i2.p1  ORF type:complete len:130 (-),score=22.28 TRINITY_DN14752_c0_g2_i2:232-621(-)
MCIRDRGGLITFSYLLPKTMRITTSTCGSYSNSLCTTVPKEGKCNSLITSRRVEKYKELDKARRKFLKDRCKSLLKNNAVFILQRKSVLTELLKSKRVKSKLKKRSKSPVREKKYKRAVFNSGETNVIY